MTRSIFRHPEGARLNSTAIAYAFLTYGLGWWAAFQQHVTLWLIGVILLAHAMCIAAYLLHECLHKLIFKMPSRNRKLGTALMWITACCYSRFENLQYKHLRHHRDNADVVLFNHDEWFRNHLEIRIICAVLEWFYIPIYDYIVRGFAMFSAFIFTERSAQRKRAVVVILIRSLAFVLVFLLSPRAVLGYVVAYTIMLQILRFMDAFQHDYDGFVDMQNISPISHSRDSAYEAAHTFSNLLSAKYDFLNVLVLHFGFHNAHHRNPAVPWHALPVLHRTLFDNAVTSPVIPLSEQIRSFHRYRVLRLYGGRVDEYVIKVTANLPRVGGNAASFLMSI